MSRRCGLSSNIRIIMRNILQKYDLQVSKDQYQILQKFIEIFIEKNAHINLSAIREPEAIWEKHIADSLIASKYFDFAGKILDL